MFSIQNSFVLMRYTITNNYNAKAKVTWKYITTLDLHFTQRHNLQKLLQDI